MKKILTTIKNFFLQIFNKKPKPFQVGRSNIGQSTISKSDALTVKKVEGYLKARALNKSYQIPPLTKEESQVYLQYLKKKYPGEN
jgi:hypothetical protein